MRWLPLLVAVACARSTPVEQLAATVPSCALPPGDPARAAPGSADALTLPGLPLWAWRYAATAEDVGRFFDLDALMAAHALTRAQAAEVQNGFRDRCVRARAGDGDPTDVDRLFAEALADARAGRFERLDVARLDAARFVVAFDLDETLLDQSFRPEVADAARACATIRYTADDPVDRGKDRAVVLAPGWERAFAAVRGLGGAIVLYSANLDDRIHAIARRWTWEGVPVAEHPDVAGILANHHLVQVPKAAGVPVAEPSKDLRILDPALRRVVLVDDNPTRTFQPASVRLTYKFEADVTCAPGADPAARAAREADLDAFVAELTEAAEAARSQGLDFADAYRPYTWIGRLAVDARLAAAGGTRADAIAWVRAHPEVVDRRF